MDGVTARVQRECFRVRGNDITIRNMHCEKIGPPQVRPNLPEGLHIETGNNIVIEDSSMQGFQMTMDPDRYWNGDGVAAELPVTGLQILRVTSNGNTDAGFDIKPPVVMDDVSASDNCRNFRFWARSDIGTITVGDTIKRGGRTNCAGIWVKGNVEAPPVIHIKKLIVRMKNPGEIIRVEDGPAEIIVDQCDIQAPPGSTMLHMPHPDGKESLGPSCKT